MHFWMRYQIFRLFVCFSVGLGEDIFSCFCRNETTSTTVVKPSPTTLVVAATDAQIEPITVKPDATAKPIATTAKPTDPITTTAKPTDPIITTANPTNPITTTAKPTDPIPATAKPTDPITTTAKPTDPAKPTNPVATTAQPADPETAAVQPTGDAVTTETMANTNTTVVINAGTITENPTEPAIAGTITETPTELAIAGNATDISKTVEVSDLASTELVEPTNKPTDSVISTGDNPGERLWHRLFSTHRFSDRSTVTRTTLSTAVMQCYRASTARTLHYVALLSRMEYEQPLSFAG
jgi:hypothetical protein